MPNVQPASYAQDVEHVHPEERLMNTTISQLVATEHVADLRRAAARSRAAGFGFAEEYVPAVELRLVDAQAPAVRRLAALDDAPDLTGPVLIALVNDDAVAGLALQDKRVVANPFVPTREVLALLRLRAEHVSGATVRRRWPRRLGARLA
jgi:hypothetical protein